MPKGTRACTICGQTFDRHAQTPTHPAAVVVPAYTPASPVANAPATQAYNFDTVTSIDSLQTGANAPTTQAYNPAQNRAAFASVKAGPERAFGIILIAVAILGLFLEFAQIDYRVLSVTDSTPVLFFVNLLAHIVVPAAMLLTGVFAFSFAKRVSSAQALKTWLQRVALADIILGAGMVVMTLLDALQFAGMFGNNEISYSLLRVLSTANLGLFFLFTVASAVVHFTSSGKAKALNTSSTPSIVAGILLVAYTLYQIIYLLSLSSIYTTLEDHGYEYGFIARVLGIIFTIGVLILVAILVVRGVFWMGAAKKVAVYLSAAPPVQGSGSYAPPYGVAPAPNPVEISGGAKFGYFTLGFVFGLMGVLISWLVNKDMPSSGAIVKISVIGLVASIAATCLCFGTIILSPVAPIL
jgi:hypothetical protein